MAQRLHAIINFGIELSSLQKRSESFLAKNSVSVESLEVKFTELKLFWFINSSHPPRGGFCITVNAHLQSQYNNLKHVFTVLKLLHVLNVKVERAFPFVKKVKTDWRNQLAEKTLSSLVRKKITLIHFQMFLANKPRRLAITNCEESS